MSTSEGGAAPQTRSQNPGTHNGTHDANSDSTSGELNEWKQRPPYSVHTDSDPDFKPLYTGSCHCGKIAFQLSRERPLDAKICHCRTCQKLHGAPFQWCAIFHKEDINFLRGVHDLGWYESSEKTCVHKLPCKVSCAYCRTPIMDEGRNMILLFPTLIDFRNNVEREKFSPTCHMFYSRRVVDVPDGKPKWTEINGESELMADSPEEMKHKKPKSNDEKGNHDWERSH